MSVSLVDGTVEVRVRLGSGSFDADLRPPLDNVRYDDGQWHRVVVSRQAREVRYSRSWVYYYISRESYGPREMYCGHARLCV